MAQGRKTIWNRSSLAAYQSKCTGGSQECYLAWQIQLENCELVTHSSVVLLKRSSPAVENHIILKLDPSVILTLGKDKMPGHRTPDEFESEQATH